MDSFHFWKDDYEREVEEVIAERRRAREKGDPSEAAPGEASSGRLVDLVIPSVDAAMATAALQNRLAKTEAEIADLRARAAEAESGAAREREQSQAVRAQAARATLEFNALQGELVLAREQARLAEERRIDAAQASSASAEIAATRIADGERALAQALERARRAEEAEREQSRALSSERAGFREALKKLAERLNRRAAGERALAGAALDGERARAAELTQRVEELSASSDASRREAMAATALARHLDEALGLERSKCERAERAAAEFRVEAEERLRCAEERATKALACVEAARLESVAALERARETKPVPEVSRPVEENLAPEVHLPSEIFPPHEILASPREPELGFVSSKEPQAQEPWQARDEQRYLLWIMIGVFSAAAIVAAVLVF